LQRSQRYCNEFESDTVEPKFDDIYQQNIFEESVNLAFENYDLLLDAGMKKEDARMILPQCTTTELIVVGNFQAWIDFINLRETKEAQWEIRAVATEIREQLATIAPNIFGGNK
jgi:thymidylate synthase (FAD)